jgi:hypothetical protein
MKKFNKQLLIPILTVVALIVKQIFKIDIPDAAIDIASELIMGAISLAGLFMHPHVTETPTNGGQTDGTQEPTTFISNNK